MYLIVFVPSKARLMHEVGLGFMERAYGARPGLGLWDPGECGVIGLLHCRAWAMGPWGRETVGS